MSPRKQEESAANADEETDAVSQNWDELNDRIERLRQDIAAINESVSGLARAGMSEGRERVTSQVDDLSRRTRELGEELHAVGRRAARDAGRQASDLSHELEATINRNPFTAMLVAVGLGFIIGLSSRGRG